MEARIKLLENVCFVGETGSGHAIVMDGAAEAGGRNLGPRPMELLLIGAGGCTSFDVVTILRNSKQDVADCEVQVKAERAETDPKVFRKIHLHFVVTGRHLIASRVEHAIRLSAEKYCSATIMLAKTAEVTHSHEVIDLAASEAEA